MSESSAFSMSVFLTFVMQLLNGALFLKANFLPYALLFDLARAIVPSVINMHHCNHTNHILALMF